MNRSEAATLLALVQAYDRRTVGEMDIIAWADALDDIDLNDAAAAVKAWFRDRRDWLLPVDVRQLVRKLRAERAAAPEDVPDADPDDVPAYLDALRAGRQRVGDALVARPVQQALPGTFNDVTGRRR